MSCGTLQAMDGVAAPLPKHILLCILFLLLNFNPFVADIIVRIEEETILAAENRSAAIRAMVYSSDLSSILVEWSHNGQLIDLDGRNVYTLNIGRVERTLMGTYGVIVAATTGNEETLQSWHYMVLF